MYNILVQQVSSHHLLICSLVSLTEAINQHVLLSARFKGSSKVYSIKTRVIIKNEKLNLNS
jgi:hypothetical protein